MVLVDKWSYEKSTLMGYILIYKTRYFASLIKKEPLTDQDLIEACREMSSGLIDAELGGNLFKKRVAIGNKGKSGSYRTMVGAVIGKKYFFLFAFAKSKKANISTKEQLALKELAKTFVEFDEHTLESLVMQGELIKIGDL